MTDQQEYIEVRPFTGEQIFHFDVPFCVGRAFSAGTDRLSGGGQSVTDR